jgi:hypothetical protein
MAKRCIYCRQWYRPYLPMKHRQKMCGALSCRRKLKRSLDRAWRRSDPQWRKDLLAKRRESRKVYMRKYRAERPAYRAREAARLRTRRQRACWAPHSLSASVVTQEL